MTSFRWPEPDGSFQPLIGAPARDVQMDPLLQDFQRGHGGPKEKVCTAQH